MGFIRALASLKVTVGLLAVILVVLAVGTIVESIHGAERARVVYYSVWFTALLGAFAVNLIASLIEKWPYGKLRLGYLLTHASMLVILGGSLLTATVKVEGRLFLWEGQTSNKIFYQSPDGEQGEIELPFAVRLDSFEIDVYPGTQRPAMFRSRVTVLDESVGSPLPAVIEMNKELHHGGFSFFQSSYQQSGGREATILSVSKDPGQAVVFVGYTLLVLGMCVVLLTRFTHAETRRPRVEFTPPAGGLGLPTVGCLLLALLAATSVSAQGLTEAQLDAVRLLPVQHDGRVMPLDTMARESVRKVTGGQRLNGADPVATVLAWSQDAATWREAAIIEIGNDDLAQTMGMAGADRSSFAALLASDGFRKVVSEARARAEAEEPLPPIQEDALELEGRLYTLNGFLTAQAIRCVPVSPNPVERWLPPESLRSVDGLLALRDQLEAQAFPGYPSRQAMEREVLYNRARPSRIAWLILVPALIAALVGWTKDNRQADVVAAIGLLLGFAVMTWGLALRWQVGGRIPASNMYESLLFLAWGVGLFALLAAMFSRNRLVIFNAAAMATLVKLLSDFLPMDPFIHPMPPVLSGTPWLAIHVPIIMVSYSVLALGVLVAHMRVGIPIFAATRKDLAERMDLLLYWYMHIGSILLIVGILTGSIWAASSWGRYWGWDPKEVWSLIAFLAYMAILHSRLDKVLGAFGVAVCSIIAFWTIIMTYIGVNYVLAAGLHSYGFGGGAVVKWMLLCASVETAFLVAGWAANRRAAAAAA